MTALPYARALRAGLTLSEAAVLEALWSLIDPEADIVTASASRYDLAKLSGLSPFCVQRALVGLRDKGFVVRRQDTRCAGSIALTTILPRAWSFMADTDEALPEALPEAFAQLLILQPRCVIAGLVAALQQRAMPADALREHFCGIDAQWKQITDHLALLTPPEEASASPAPSHTIALTLADGQTARVDLRAMAALAPRPVDGSFLQEVLARVVRARGTRSGTGFVALLAEAAYTRAMGFVRGHEYRHATNVLAKVMSTPGWRKPLRIDPVWYRAAERACA